MQDTIFWIVVALFIAAAMGLLTFYLWRKPAAPAAEESVDALNVLRDQRAELDAEVAAGRMTEGEREARVMELARRVHEEGLATAAPASAAPTVRRRPLLAVVIALLVPAIAIPVYFKVGTPAALDPAARLASASPHGEFTPEQLKALLDKVRQKVAAKPDDIEGWIVLGRGSQMANDFAGAAAAFERASALKPDDAALLSDYADSLAMAQNRSLAGKPWELIQQALRIDPKLPKALALAASAEMEQRRFESAKGYWQRLLALVPADSDDATDIRSTIAQLDAASAAAGGKSVPAAAPASPPAVAGNPHAGAGVATAATPTGAATAAAPTGATTGATTTAASDKVITGTVTLAPALAARVAPDDVLYVFARAEGSRMPLAILRLKASELPKQYRLDDSQAMMGGGTLSATPKVRVEARISKSGDATPKPGDLRGETPLIAPGASNADIVISEVISAPVASTGAAAPGAMSPATVQAKSPVAQAPAANAKTASNAPPAAAVPGKAITGVVKLAPALATKVSPDDTLFVYARAAEGSRMPLAILRLKASELPKQFRLDDTLGMAGGPPLSSTPQVRIEARVSKSGQATAASGDLRGESGVIAVGAANVELTIDRVVP